MERSSLFRTLTLLVALGAPPACQPGEAPVLHTERDHESAERGEQVAPGGSRTIDLTAIVNLEATPRAHLKLDAYSGGGRALYTDGFQTLPLALDGRAQLIELHDGGRPTVTVEAGPEGLEFSMLTLALPEEVPEPDADGPAGAETVTQGLGVNDLVGARFPFACRDGSRAYHFPGSEFHRISGGILNADDTYALDLNCASDNDAGATVGAIGSGTVVGRSDASGWILIQHGCQLRWLGYDYNRCYTGYLHMANLAVRVGDNVVAGQRLGTVSNAGTAANHLHTATYVGDHARGVNGNLAFLKSVNPATALGANFRAFDYAGNITYYYVDDQRSAAPFVFQKFGTAGDWRTDAAFGDYGSMTYNLSRAGAADNIGKWNYPGVPTAGTYVIWAFVPRQHGTTRSASYKVYVNNGLVGTYVKNQLAISDDWIQITSRALAAGAVVRVELADNTGEANAQIAYDTISMVRKSDVRMTQ